MYNKLIDWLEGFSRPCFYKENFGFACPGCGFQRALISLLKGNIVESVKFYPALLPIIFLIIFLILHLKFKFKYGNKILKYTFLLIIIIILLSYIVKLIYFPHYH